MSINSIRKIAVLAVLFFLVPGSHGGMNPQQSSSQAPVLRMQEAANLIANGDLSGAENIYDEMLRDEPSSKEALLARGHVRAWQRKHAQARDDFSTILRSEPNNLSALNGLGYSYAWAGRYEEAENQFRQTLAIFTDQLEARKGLAFVALWRGDAKEAVRRFEAVAAQAPTDAEAQVGLGQAFLAAGRARAARNAFQQAQQLDPQREDALQGREAARLTEPVLEATVWGGNTWFGDADDSKFGLRSAEVALWPVRNARVWFQYDNGLSLDNVALVQSDRDVPTYSVGGLAHWKRHYTSRIEFAWREFSGNIGQRIVRAEQVFLLPRSYAFKVGGWVGPREDDRTEWTVHTGVGVPVGERFRLEPLFFYSRTGLPNEREWRLLFAGEYAFPHGWRLGGGLAGGKTNHLTGASDTLWDGFVKVSAPLGDYLRPQFVARRETAGNTSFTVLAFGFTVYVPR